MQLCACVNKWECGLECVFPLLLDPVTKCDCIEMKEYAAYFRHSKGANCHSDEEGEHNEFIFNFYGPVYTVNGISHDQDVNIHKDNDCKDCGGGCNGETTTKTTIEDELYNFSNNICKKTFNTVVTTFDCKGN